MAGAFNQFQLQMHRLRPFLTVQLDHGSNAQSLESSQIYLWTLESFSSRAQKSRNTEFFISVK